MENKTPANEGLIQVQDAQQATDVLTPLTGHLVQVQRAGVSAAAWNGFVVGVGETCLLLATVREFVQDGYALMRLADVTQVRRGDTEVFFELVMQREGLWPPKDPHPLDASDLMEFDAALRGIQRAAGWAIMENEPEATFEIGRLVFVGATSVRYRWVTVDGRLLHEVEEVPLDDLTLVRFGEHYLRMFARHAREDAEGAETLQ